MSDDTAMTEGGGELAPQHSPRQRIVDSKLLEMLACPLTKAPLKWRPETAELISFGAKLAYPVRDGVPIMLPSEARRLEEDELSA